MPVFLRKKTAGGVMKSEKIKKRTHRRTIQISLTIMPVCLLLIFGIVSGLLYVREINRQISRSLEITALQLKQRCDEILEQTAQVYGELLKEEDIRRILCGKLPGMSSYSYIRDVIGRLGGPDYLKNYISGFSYLNLEHEWVLSNRGMYTFSELNNQEEIDRMLDDELILQNWKRKFWLNGTDMEQDKSRCHVPLAGLSYIILEPLIGSPIQGALVVNMNTDTMFRSIYRPESGYELLIYDANGDAVYTTAPDLTASAGELLEDITPSAGQDFRKSGMKFYGMVSPSTGCFYLAACRPADFGSLMAGFAVIFGLLMLAAMILALFVRRAYERIYRPVSQLISQTQRLNSENTEITDEFLYLQQNLSRLYQDNSEMEQRLESHIGQLTELLMRRLLGGEIGEAEILNQQKQLGIRSRNCYAMISVTLKGGERSNMESMLLLIAGSIPGEILQMMLMPPYWNGTEILFLAGADKENEISSGVEEFLVKLEEYIVMRTGYSVRAAVSNVYYHLTRTNHAYYECLEARKCEAVYYADVADRKEIRVIYNINLEKQLAEAIGSGDLDKSCSLFEEFMEWLMKSNARLYEQSMILYRMLTTILTAANNAGISVNEVFQDACHNVYQGLYKLYHPEEIREYFIGEVIKPVIHALNNTRSGAADQVWNRIVALIQENEGDITLAECADILGYHPGYIWRVMKSRADMTFADYLLSYKLDLAKKLLEETDMSVADIAARLHYNSPQNFIRFFSKMEKTTPGKYRTLHGKIRETEGEPQK